MLCVQHQKYLMERVLTISVYINCDTVLLFSKASFFVQLSKCLLGKKNNGLRAKMAVGVNKYCTHKPTFSSIKMVVVVNV